MRWTTENETILWRTIFQTQTLNLELDKVSEAWPGDEKPTPKALKEKLDKYRRSSSNNVTFSMGKTPSAPSLRKTRAGKPTAASATASSPTPDDRISGAKDGPAGVSVSSPIAGGDHPGGHAPAASAGNGTRRGRGRPRKNPVKETPVKETLQEDDQLDAAVEPASKKVKVEGMSLSPSHSTIEIQVPDTPLSARLKTENNKGNTRPGLGTKRKLSFREGGKANVEGTEEYSRCGQEINCEGACCGEPGCADCFGEWKDEVDSPQD